MNIVVIGNGGRESAIIKKLSKTKKIINIYGLGNYLNPDIVPLLKGFRLMLDFDLDEGMDFIKKVNPRYVVIGPEKYLQDGFSNKLREENIPCIGPTSLLARIETSKLFCRNFLKQNKFYFLSPMFFQITRETDDSSLLKYFEILDNKFVVKPDGLMGERVSRFFSMIMIMP